MFRISRCIDVFSEILYIYVRRNPTLDIMVSVRPLGVATARCFQTLLTLDSHDARILVDVGWDDKLSDEYLSELLEILPSVDIVLLTHASFNHCGAFCYLRAKYPQFRSVPTFATLPVIRLGMLTTLDTYRSVGLCGPFDSDDVFGTRDIEQLWSEVQPVKYSQPVQVPTNPKLEGTVLTAFNAGHSLGGSLWRISDGVDSVVIGMEWNHARDAHLSGAFLESKTGQVVPDLQKPTLLVTSTDVGSGIPLTKARQRFLQNIDDAIKRGGTVLLPTSLGTRSLELLLILEKHMASNHGNNKSGVPLILCSFFGKQAVTQAASMLEWMVPSIMSDWQVQNESPFEQGRIQHVHDLASIAQKWPTGPKVLLATGEALESGFSKQAFLSFVAEDPKSTVIFTELIADNTLASQLIDYKTAGESATELISTIPSIEYDEQKPLSGNALKNYRAKQEEERETQEQAEALDRRNQQLIDTTANADDDLSDSDSEFGENDMQTTGAGVFLQENDVYDYACHPDSNNEKPIMFPTLLKKPRFDEYGDSMPHGMFTAPKERAAEKARSAEDETIMSDGIKAKTEQEAYDAGAQSLTLGYDEDVHPMKMVKSIKRNLKLACWAVYTDMNGLTNLRSMQMILRQIQPARLVVLPENLEVCEAIKNTSKEFAIADHEVSFERTNFSVNVRIDQSLCVKWQKVEGGYSVARVGGTLEFDPTDRSKRSDVVMVRGADSKDKEEKAESKISIGDLRLTALRHVLAEKGMKAEFRGQGMLVCADKVIVKKDEGNNFTLQGGLEPEYYIVRDVIRQFIALV